MARVPSFEDLNLAALTALESEFSMVFSTTNTNQESGLLVFHTLPIRLETSVLHQPPGLFAAQMNAIMQRIAETRSLEEPPRPPTPVPPGFGHQFRYRSAMASTVDLPPHCTICLEQFKSNEILWTLHTSNCTMHKRCLDKWFRHSNRCPSCNLQCKGTTS